MITIERQVNRRNCKRQTIPCWTVGRQGARRVGWRSGGGWGERRTKLDTSLLEALEAPKNHSETIQIDFRDSFTYRCNPPDLLDCTKATSDCKMARSDCTMATLDCTMEKLANIWKPQASSLVCEGEWNESDKNVNGKMNRNQKKNWKMNRNQTKKELERSLTMPVTMSRQGCEVM